MLKTLRNTTRIFIVKSNTFLYIRTALEKIKGVKCTLLQLT